MKYYYHYGKNGSCEVICTRCFIKLGVATELTAIRQLEVRHICGEITHDPLKLPGDGLSSQEKSVTLHFLRRFIGLPGKIKWPNMMVVFAAIAVLLYGLPTTGEFMAAEHLSPWLAIILPGDLLGCVCMAAVFRMYRTGLLLYLGLTVIEASLYLSHTLGKNELPWVVDIVPAVVVASMILRERRRSRFRTQVSRG